DWCARGRTNLCERYYTLGLQADGGLAERVRVPAATCVAVPPGCSDDAAALAQPFAVGIHAVARAQLAPGDSLAVLGAGGIGAFAIAAAAAAGASRVIAVDVDPERLRTALAVGATDVVDARSTDVPAAIRAHTAGAGAHAVIEVTGIASGPATAVAATRRGGCVVVVGLQEQPVELDLLDMTLREVDLRTSLAHVLAEDLGRALEQLAAGRLAAALTDRVIGLGALVVDGLEPLAAGRVRGKIVVDPHA
ncbi:MAG TPA: zinc-binding dehydrogenase, partial [Conexibacter sp.]|nr:zinc-binding dehydrogenase [Conexibacter sp.]